MNTTTPASELRVEVLACMAKLTQQNLGHTKVMKLCYFLQELEGVPLGYDFTLYTYGPYQPEVLSDLATACNLGAVAEKTVKYSRGYGYDISAGTHAEKMTQDLKQNDPVLFAQIERVVNEFGSFGAAELELRSTIFFVDRELTQSSVSPYRSVLVERVGAIKPRFSREDIQKAADEMADKGWLKTEIRAT